MFELDSRLQQDTVVIGQFELCMVLLHKDANYPWVILVPKRANIKEIHHLADDDQMQLMKESCHLSEVMTSLFAPTTMNVAALGNMVPQLHVHHVARFEGDAAWPGAIWGKGPAKDYDQATLEERLQKLHASLVGMGFEPGDHPASGSGNADVFSP